MRLTFNYLILRGLVLVLVGCAVPYYGAPPAPVYYLVQPAQIYYSAQPPSVSYLPPQAPSADVPRERHTVAEQSRRAPIAVTAPAKPRFGSIPSR